MKLQKFIENYQKNQLSTPTHASERPYSFKTSESIGTLNSYDENATDRSFAVKEILKTNSHSNSIEHLRALCQSDKNLNSSRSNNSHLSEKQEDSFSSPSFNRKTSNNSFVKNRGILQQQDGDISFSVCPENVEYLNSQAPSELYEGCPTEQIPLQQSQQICLEGYRQIMRKMICLENQNKQMEQRLNKSRSLETQLFDKQQTIYNQLSNLKQSVSSVIQENIQLQNKIKEMLLRHEMEKYSFSSGDSHFRDHFLNKKK